MNPELEKTCREYVRTKAKLAEIQRRMYAQIYDFSKSDGDRRGWQTEVVAVSELTRERIRQIIAAEEKRRADQ